MGVSARLRGTIGYSILGCSPVWVPRELLLRHLEYVKTGLPGVAWVKLESERPWPEQLQIRVPQ